MRSTLQSILARSPRLHTWTRKAKYWNHPYRKRIVDRSSEICIDGYPRSGTSFANRAFARAQGRDVRIATHAHHPSHVKRAVQLGTPTLVIFRQPMKSVASHFALREELRAEGDSRPPLDVDSALRNYVEFHEGVLSVADSVVLAPFDDVTSDYGAVIERVNQRFGTSLVPFEHTDAHVDELFASEGRHLSPSEQRRAFNEEGQQRYAASTESLRDRAEQVYEQMLRAAQSQGAAS